MIEPTFTVILPTIGRATLARTLESLYAQDWRTGDELLVLADDNIHEVRQQVFGTHQLPFLRVVSVLGGPHKDWGHTPRNLHMKDALGSHLCHFDDDDVALPNMMSAYRDSVRAAPDHVHLFRMLPHKTRRLVWKKAGLLQRAAVSTQNIVHPNRPSTFGVWKPMYGGDFFFIQETVAKCANQVLWRDVVTCVYGPPADMTYQDVLAWSRVHGR